MMFQEQRQYESQKLWHHNILIGELSRINTNSPIPVDVYQHANMLMFSGYNVPHIHYLS